MASPAEYNLRNISDVFLLLNISVIQKSSNYY